MRLYIAGVEHRVKEFITGEFECENALLSYFYLQDIGDERKEALLRSFDNVFVDSGGFSARMQGEEISLQEYIDFIKKYEDLIDVYANLDTADEHETDDNLKEMEDQGLNPIPVIHSNDFQKTLEWYKDYDKVALGGVAGEGLGKDLEFDFLRHCFDKLPDDTNVHGFGITSQDHMRMFPFDSVDSTSWFSGSRFGIFYYYDRGELTKLGPKEFKKKFGKSFNQIHYSVMDKWNLQQWKKIVRDLQ